MGMIATLKLAEPPDGSPLAEGAGNMSGDEARRKWEVGLRPDSATEPRMGNAVQYFQTCACSSIVRSFANSLGVISRTSGSLNAFLSGFWGRYRARVFAFQFQGDGVFQQPAALGDDVAETIADFLVHGWECRSLGGGAEWLLGEPGVETQRAQRTQRCTEVS